jgi:APA family basic amino acid/polyamine antiporter
MLLGSARILMAISRDGLLPPFFASVHPTFKTPWKAQLVVGVGTAVLAGLFPIEDLVQMTNIGTLFAFAIVCAAVLVMRKKHPEAERPFRCPMVPLIPVLGIVLCLVLMFSLPVANWYRLLGWLAGGLVIYFAYSRHHSVLAKMRQGD